MKNKGLPGNKVISKGFVKMKIVQNELGKFVGGQDYGICKEGKGQDVKFVFAWLGFSLALNMQTTS